jgi:hypothetical protein
MMTKTIGTKYEQTKDLDIAQIAKLVRQDIAAEVKAGLLPKVKYSVRISRYSMGQSLDVTIGQADRSPIQRIEAIVFAYNYDGSDSQTDYFDNRFYTHIRCEE